MGFLNFFRKSNGRKAKQKKPERWRGFRRLRFESLESRSMLSGSSIQIQGTVEIDNLAMAGGNAVPVANATMQISVGHSKYLIITNSDGKFSQPVLNAVGSDISFQLTAQSPPDLTASHTSYAVYQFGVQGTYTMPRRLSPYTWTQSSNPQTRTPYTLQASGNNFNLILDAGTTKANINIVTESGHTVTVTTAVANGFSVGDTVAMSVAAVPRYDGTFTIASIVNPTTFTFNDSTSGLTGSFTGTATSATSSQQAAQGFAVFSIVGDYEEYARNYLNATLPRAIVVNYPSGDQPSSFSADTNPHSFFDHNTQWVNIASADMIAAAPDTIGHEFGHLVASFSYFAIGGGGTHFFDYNQRAVPPSDADPVTWRYDKTPTASEAQTAFTEAWADYFAVSAKAASVTSNLNIAALSSDNTTMNGWQIATTGGQGEDNEASIARFLFALDQTGENTNPIDEVIAPMGSKGLFQLLAGSAANPGPQNMAQLFQKLAGTHPNDNHYLASIGDMAQSMNISPNVSGVVVATTGAYAGRHQIVFSAPLVYGKNISQLTIGGSVSRVYESTAVFLNNQLSIAVFNTAWQPVFDSTNPTITLGSTASVVTSSTTSTMQWTVTLTTAQWNTVVNGNGVYWVVEATDPNHPTTVLYWSNAVEYTPGAHASATSFISSGNALALSYGILPPDSGWPTDDSTVTIPPFTINVFAVPTGSFYDPRTSDNQIVSYAVSDWEDLNAPPDAGNYDFQKTIEIPASEINSQLLASLVAQGNDYLVAEMDFGDGSPPVLARFQGGTFQTADANGTVYVFGDASLNDDTPDTAQFTNSVTIASAGGSVSVSGSGSDGDTAVSYSQTYSTASSEVDFFAYDNTSTADASGLAASTSLKALGGDGDNTILGGQGNDTIVVGNGTNTITDGDGNDTLTAGNGNNIITVGDGNDSVDAGNGNNTVACGNGNDILQAGNGNNLITAGDGGDWVIAGDGNNNVTLGNGNDILDVGNGDNSLVAGNGSDRIVAGGGNNAIVCGSSSDDGLWVGDGDNTISLGTGGFRVTAGNGNNVFDVDASTTQWSYIYAGGGNNDVLLTHATSGDTPVVNGGSAYDWSTLWFPLPTRVAVEYYGLQVPEYSILSDSGTGDNLTFDNGATVYWSEGVSANANVTLDNATTLNLQGQTVTVASLNVINGGVTNGSIIVTGTVTVQSAEVDANVTAQELIATGGYSAMTGNNTFTSVTLGTSATDTATLAVGANALGDAPVTFGGPCTLQALDDLSLTQNIATPDATGISATFDSNGFSVVLSGQISGGAHLIVTNSSGGGSVTLAGDNSYTDGTQIASGMLVFSSTASLPTSGLVSIQDGGELETNDLWQSGTPVTSWLASGLIDPSSTGALALAGDSSESIDLNGFPGLSIGAAATDATYSGTITPDSTFNSYQFGGGPGTLTVASVLADYNNTSCGVSINGNVVFSAANTYTGDTNISNATLQTTDPLALATTANINVNGVNGLLQCADGSQIGGDLALNDGGSINLGSGSTIIMGTLAVTSIVNGSIPSYWSGTGTVEGVVTVSYGGILTVGQNGPATLTAPGGVLITGSGQVVMGDPASAIVGTIDDEGWQSISLVGQVGGSSSALVLGALQQYAPTVTLGTASGDTGTNTYSTIYVVSGTLLINQQSAVSVGATLVIGDPAAFGETAPIVSAPSQGSTQVTGGHGDSTTTGSGGGTCTLGDDGPPPVDPAVLAAEAAAQAAAAAAAHARNILFHQRMAAGVAVLNSLGGIINPQDPEAAIFDAGGMVMQIAPAVRAANGGTLVGASASVINDVLQQVFAANNMTVTPAADGQGTLGSDATEGFPADTTDGLLALDLGILQFLQANTVVLNG